MYFIVQECVDRGVAAGERGSRTGKAEDQIGQCRTCRVIGVILSIENCILIRKSLLGWQLWDISVDDRTLPADLVFCAPTQEFRPVPCAFKALGTRSEFRIRLAFLRCCGWPPSSCKRARDAPPSLDRLQASANVQRCRQTRDELQVSTCLLRLCCTFRWV